MASDDRLEHWHPVYQAPERKLTPPQLQALYSRIIVSERLGESLSDIVTRYGVLVEFRDAEGQTWVHVGMQTFHPAYERKVNYDMLFSVSAESSEWTPRIESVRKYFSPFEFPEFYIILPVIGGYGIAGALALTLLGRMSTFAYRVIRGKNALA